MVKYFALAFFLISGFLYFFLGQPSKSSTICHTGGGVKVVGFDWIDDTTLLKCDCQGKIIHQSNPNVLDSDTAKCQGKINYSCYQITAPLEKNLIDPDFSSYLESNYSTMPCPPHRWSGN